MIAAACAFWIAASLCAWAACRKIKRERLLRELRAEAERTHRYYNWLRSWRTGAIDTTN